MKSLFAGGFVNWVIEARAGTGVAITLSGVLAMWNAAKSLRSSSRKPFLGAVAGMTELDDGIVSNADLGGGWLKLP